ncbi:glycosyltransferase family 4 protein [Terriglobus albidus]|uniref:Glycosyltransferase family 4 protein n=1 Tax=Terriglobus albidus TaxID=1592106 RepID=A0A5B9EHU7_9BACT|nr:glycosyltransferase [Terriglobus albidus]QEE29646.1 glycosyltransferase family 4 protein [Terriglobus albidus]
MRVLLVTFSFPPAGGVGVLRALSLAKYLPENGIEVEVLTARNAPAVQRDDTLASQVPFSVIVHRCWTLDLPFGVRKAIKRILSETSDATSATVAEGGRVSKPRLLKKIFADMLLPDPQIGWLPLAVPAAARLIRKKQIDLVLITVPPFSSSRMVSFLRRKFPVLPIVLEFRDEWLNTTIDLVSYSNSPRAKQIAARTEKEAVHDATLVVAVTDAAERTIRQRYPQEPSSKFVCVPNGYDSQPSLTMPSMPALDTVTLTFIGTVYRSSDPSSFIEAVHALPEIIKSRLRIRFIGHIESPHYRHALMSLGSIIDLQGVLPQAEALQAIKTTDYLLLISHDPINVAAKVYDYLGGGRPIIAAIHPDGDIRRILEETEAGIWADVRDANSIRQLLAQIIEATATSQCSFRPRADVIARYHRRSITRRYASLLQKLVGGTSQREVTR